MENKRQQLVPSSDLADFYTRKIATCLSIIYSFRYDLDNNKYLIVKINSELEEIYKQIRNRLLKHELKELVDKYNEINNKLYKLKPLGYTYIKDTSSGDRIKKPKITKCYYSYKMLVTEKECLIWDCLDCLGLLGKVDIQTKRLR
jgi:flagellin-specific chaperone FliS